MNNADDVALLPHWQKIYFNCVKVATSRSARREKERKGEKSREKGAFTSKRNRGIMKRVLHFENLFSCFLLPST